ncbi:MAG: PDZ domain-containing protein [Streptococcaceae bacterium]|jgi:PDZ domain-containing protein|nr:PDZ domain-containing protein [Streptococcaceae bacterium]
MKTKRKFPKWLKVTLVIALPLLAAAMLLWPQPYFLEMPGTAAPVAQMVKVSGKSDAEKGDLSLTTVEITQANFAMMLWAKTQPFVSVETAQNMLGGLSNQQFDLVNQFYMQTAQNVAVIEAFKAAGKPYTLSYQGVYVLQITNDSTFKGQLEIADTITSINKVTFKSSAEMIAYVEKQKVGAPVEIKVTRMSGGVHNFSGHYIKLSNGKTGIGIGLTDHTNVVTEPKVTIDAGNIGGPSAGMMFTLEIYQQLTGKNLTQGRHIAGTGTIEEDGSIGQIGGVDKKVATASKAGATVFLAPDSGNKNPDENNYLAAVAAAKKAHTSMKIIPVKTLQDALSYLEK